MRPFSLVNTSGETDVSMLAHGSKFSSRTLKENTITHKSTSQRTKRVQPKVCRMDSISELN